MYLRNKTDQVLKMAPPLIRVIQLGCCALLTEERFCLETLQNNPVGRTSSLCRYCFVYE